MRVFLCSSVDQVSPELRSAGFCFLNAGIKDLHQQALLISSFYRLTVQRHQAAQSAFTEELPQGPSSRKLWCCQSVLLEGLRMGTFPHCSPPVSPHQAGTWAVHGCLTGVDRSLHTPGAWVRFTLMMTSTSLLSPVTQASAFSR